MTSTAAEPLPAPAAAGSTRAADIMSAPVITVSTQDDLWTAWGLMYRAGFRHLVVVEGTRCVGVLDDRRIVAEWPLGPTGRPRTLVGDVVSREVHGVGSDTPASQIARIMLDQRVDGVPVVSGRGEVIGLVTCGDLLTVMAEPAGRC